MLFRAGRSSSGGGGGARRQTSTTAGGAAREPTAEAEYDDDAPDEAEQLLFDRVLADVPCSCDGTLRKNPAHWRQWDVGVALALHQKQLKILLHGLHVLREGGVLVYSTCSFNPIENEAVVLAALRK